MGMYAVLVLHLPKVLFGDEFTKRFKYGSMRQQLHLFSFLRTYVLLNVICILKKPLQGSHEDHFISVISMSCTWLFCNIVYVVACGSY